MSRMARFARVWSWTEMTPGTSRLRPVRPSTSCPRRSGRHSGHGPRYRPEAFEREGFVHCTDGLAHLLVPANAYYRDDPRPYLALEIDLDAVAAPARFDDEACRYPHIYGPIDVAAVRARACGRNGPGTAPSPGSSRTEPFARPRGTVASCVTAGGCSR